jgi:hypothetical protein
MTIYTVKNKKVYGLTIHTIKKIGNHEYVKCVMNTTNESFTFVNLQDASDAYFYNIAGALELLKSLHEKH